MVGSTDIVENKRARPSSLYSEPYYIAESDFFPFQTIQMQKMSYLKVELGCNVAIHAQLRHSKLLFSSQTNDAMVLSRDVSQEKLLGFAE